MKANPLSVGWVLLMMPREGHPDEKPQVYSSIQPGAEYLKPIHAAAVEYNPGRKFLVRRLVVDL